VSCSQARQWLAARPDFELRPPTELAQQHLPLERPAQLLAALGRPDRDYRTILVAGTKGKGSTAIFLAAMLQAHGYRVGLYSQPHLHTLRERLRVNGVLIAPDELAAQIERLRPMVEAQDAASPQLGPLTTYEIITALALSWFAHQKVDWAVLEVGLGGRLDATNIVDPAVAIITPISYDHTHILGKTLGSIAAEKAGIVKRGSLVVSAPQRPAALAAIRRAARAQTARLTIIGANERSPQAVKVRAYRIRAGTRRRPSEPFFRFELRTELQHYPELAIYLGGMHQVGNALTAVVALESAQEQGLRPDSAALRRGLAAARWPGRLEVVRTAPLLVLDGAHNGDSAVRLREALDLHFEFDRLHLILGVFADKDLGAILRPLRTAHRLTAVQLTSPRARPAQQIAAAARRLGMAAAMSGDVRHALDAVLAEANQRDLVCVTGSLTTVAAAREALGLALAEH
jgi:dihydrofolate synthase/folylpolyglutamate synthase